MSLIDEIIALSYNYWCRFEIPIDSGGIYEYRVDD